ncbi:MAG: extracellular solute-binding protein, partial [Planctomycetes bacterium]|nr:extracellular solute-binding protein [Planctomycetota bacterium]
MSSKNSLAALAASLALALLAGCPKKDGAAPPPGRKGGKVVLYAAGDSLFTKEIIDAFGKSSDVDVEVAGDTETTRGVGLRLKIEQEKAQPRADVYWNNEIVNTVLLKKKGLLEPYKSPAYEDFPEAFRDPQGYWTAFGARVRIFLVNTNRVKEGEEPKGMDDFLDPKWKGKAGMSRPTGGTTATHAAALYELLGEEKAREFYTKLKENGIVLCNGNGHVKDQVAAGELAWGWTDTNDANVAIRDKKPVKVVYPDQGEGGIGTFLIPHSVGLVKGGPNPKNGKALVDWILSTDTEIKLAKGLSAQLPVREVLQAPQEP